MGSEKEINLGDQLITVDDKHYITYQYNTMTLKRFIMNGKQSFEFPTKGQYDHEVRVSDDEMRAVWNILNEIYGKEE